MGRARDLTGQRFGRLVAKERVGTNKWGNALWLCSCDCGSWTTTIAACLRNGDTKSCGCLFNDKQAERSAKHGGLKEAKAEHAAWMNLRAKHDYPPEWDDFVQFFCDVGERPSPTHQLTRRDPTEPHGPTNTYWRNADDDARLSATDLGDDFVVDLRSICLAEAAA